MLRTMFQKLPLALAGLSALAIGLTILTLPQVFYGFYDIDLGPGPGLRNEMRATSAGLTSIGGVLMAALFVPAWTRPATGFAALVFLAYAGGRGLGILLDGVPQAGLVEAAIFELVIGLACVVSWRQQAVPHPARGETMQTGVA